MQKEKPAKRINLQAIFAKSSSPQERFDYYMAHPEAEIDPRFAAGLKDKHVVLIAGWGARLIRMLERVLKVPPEQRYMAQPAINLRKLGTHVTIKYPRSVSIQKSTREFIEELPELHKQGGNRQIIVVGHSRGGMIATLTAMMAPHLLRPQEGQDKAMIGKVITFQSPVNGHYYTNNFLVKLLSLAGVGFMRSGGNFGLGGLTHENIHKLFSADAFRQRVSPADQKLVSDSILYFVGGTDKIPLVDKLAGPTDGVVPLDNQRRTEYGSVAGVYTDVSHLNAMIAMGSARKSASRALALSFTEAVAKSLAMGPEWDGIVSDAMEKKLRGVLKTGRVAPG
jgi:pimeloyl-ACP methyl ester carboxylesterase